MKTINRGVMLMLLAIVTIGIQNLFAQEKSKNKEQKKYRLHVVKDENGKEEITDKTFSSQDEMDAYIKEHKMDMPETGLPNISEEKVIIQKSVNKADGKTGGDKKEKKIIIIEKEEGSVNGKTSLEITYTSLNAEERAQAIQQVLNEKGKDVQVEFVKKTAQNKPPMGIEGLNAEQTDNISEVTLFPNPASGQFKVAFTIQKPVDVQLRISDLQGNEVYAAALSNYSGRFEKDIQASGMVKGAYVLDITAGNEKKTAKVVMQ